MKTIQYFSDDYLEHCRKLKPEQILEFLENFRKLQFMKNEKTKLISIKIPGVLLNAFKQKAEMNNIRYQTQIKKLMDNWVNSF